MTFDESILIANRRYELLQFLVSNPSRKRDIVDNLDVSRTTVHRAIDELLETGAISKRDGNYITTNAGELLLDTVTATEQIAETVQSSNDLLSYLPDEVPLDPVFFRDAKAVPVQPPSMEANVERAIQRLQEANHLYGLGTADNNSRWVEALYEQSAIAEQTDIDLAVTEPLAEICIERYRGVVGSLIESEYADIRVCDTLPYALWIMEGPDHPTVFLVVHGDRSEYLGHFEATTRAAAAWAKAVFRRYFRRCQPIAEFADGIGASM